MPGHVIVAASVKANLAELAAFPNAQRTALLRGIADVLNAGKLPASSTTEPCGSSEE